MYTLFSCIGAYPAKLDPPVGASPTRVIASEPYSQTGWVAVMEGAKGVGKIVTCVIVRQHGMYFAHSLFGEVYFIIDFISSK